MLRSSGVNVGFAKCFVLFMSISILFQGFVYLILAIWGLAVGKCTETPINIKDEPIKFAMNLIYFSGKECGNPIVKISDIINDKKTADIANNGQNRLKDIQEIQIDWDKASIIKDRVNIILISYIVISILWIITSLIVIVSICCVTTTKLAKMIFYWSWFLIVIIGSILDAIATGYFINDIYNTTSMENTLDYIGVIRNDTNNIVIDYLKKYKSYFVTPAIVMTFITSRVIFFWLLNTFGVIFCFSMARALSVKNNFKDVMKSKQRTPVDDIIVTPKPSVLSKESTYHLQWVHPQHNLTQQQISPKPLIIPRPILQNDLQKCEIQKSPSIISLSSRNSPQKKQLSPIISKSISFSKRISELKSKSSIDDESSTYRSCDLHPEKLDYPTPNRAFNYMDTSNSRSGTPTLPINNNRYSSTDGLLHNQPHITEELRSQLPWSYTNLFMDPEVQRKIQSHLPQDENDFPSIPTPDYTLHYPKKERPQINVNGDHW